MTISASPPPTQSDTLAIMTISPCPVSPTICEHLAKYQALKRMTEAKMHNYAHINNLHSALRNSSGTGRFMSWSPFNSPILPLLIPKTLLVFIPLPTKLYDLNFSITYTTFLSKVHTLPLFINCLYLISERMNSPCLFQRCTKNLTSDRCIFKLVLMCDDTISK